MADDSLGVVESWRLAGDYYHYGVLASDGCVYHVRLPLVHGGMPKVELQLTEDMRAEVDK